MPLSKKRKRLYPISLLKIGAWRKSLGDECEIFEAKLPQPGEYDEIWITTVFTFDIPFVLGLVNEAKKRAGVVRVGGVSASLLPEYFEKAGVEVYRGLHPEAEQFAPDYGLLRYEPEYSIAYTSRGCIRKCAFCMVPKLEPEYQNRTSWETELHPKAKRIQFYDNNWFAKPLELLMSDIEKMRELTASGRITEIDFNQGLDARLMTGELADALKGLPMKPIRFAFDGKQEDKYYQKAIRLMAERGFKTFRSYTLYNFMDTPEDFYYRMRVSAELSDELGVSVLSFPMRFQPILKVDPKRSHIGKHWSKPMLVGFMALLSRISIGGTVSMGESEFKYWFGNTPADFVKLLNYPRIKNLAEKRKVNLRMMRAANTTPWADHTGQTPVLVE